MLRVRAYSLPMIVNMKVAFIYCALIWGLKFTYGIFQCSALIFDCSRAYVCTSGRQHQSDNVSPKVDERSANDFHSSKLLELFITGLKLDKSTRANTRLTLRVNLPFHF